MTDYSYMNYDSDIMHLVTEFFKEEPPCNCGTPHGCCLACTYQRNLIRVLSKVQPSYTRTYRLYGDRGDELKVSALLSVAKLDEAQNLELEFPKGLKAVHGKETFIFPTVVYLSGTTQDPSGVTRHHTVTIHLIVEDDE